MTLEESLKRQKKNEEDMEKELALNRKLLQGFKNQLSDKNPTN